MRLHHILAVSSPLPTYKKWRRKTNERIMNRIISSKLKIYTTLTALCLALDCQVPRDRQAYKTPDSDSSP